MTNEEFFEKIEGHFNGFLAGTTSREDALTGLLQVYLAAMLPVAGQDADMKHLIGLIFTVRKYQKRFFDGDKSILSTSKRWEKDLDDRIKVLVKKYGIREVIEGKGPSSQGMLL